MQINNTPPPDPRNNPYNIGRKPKPAGVQPHKPGDPANTGDGSNTGGGGQKKGNDPQNPDPNPSDFAARLRARIERDRKK